MSDAPDCFTSRLRRARKQHRCCECPAPIVPGEIYEYVSGVWDGIGASFKTCIPCAEVRQDLQEELRRARFDDCLIIGHLQAEMAEYYE